jgi:hypothetical protein
MKALADIDIQSLKEHIIKNWMTHDGMWFYHVYKTYGIAAANTLNKAAIQLLAPIEISRACKLLGLEPERMMSLNVLQEALRGAFFLSAGDFMGFSFDFPEIDCMSWECADKACFAYRGMLRLGAIDAYECGVLYRVMCWIDCLGVTYEVAPPVHGCLMHTHGKCAGEARFFIP